MTNCLFTVSLGWSAEKWDEPRSMLWANRGPLHCKLAPMADDWLWPTSRSWWTSLTARMRVSMFSRVLLANGWQVYQWELWRKEKKNNSLRNWKNVLKNAVRVIIKIKWLILSLSLILYYLKKQGHMRTVLKKTLLDVTVHNATTEPPVQWATFQHLYIWTNTLNSNAAEQI